MNNEEMELFCYLQDDEDYENDFEQDYKRLLREDIPTLFDYIKKKDKEIAQLNKIIDELEKWLWKELESHNYSSIKLKPLKSENTIRVVSITRLMEVLDKLQELKEEGKE